MVKNSNRSLIPLLWSLDGAFCQHIYYSNIRSSPLPLASAQRLFACAYKVYQFQNTMLSTDARSLDGMSISLTLSLEEDYHILLQYVLDNIKGSFQ